MIRLQIFCCHNYLFVTDAIGQMLLGLVTIQACLRYTCKEKNFTNSEPVFVCFLKGYLLRDERLSFSA